MVEPSLEDIFPGLRGQRYQITSPKDHRYNCIAFATGDIQNWWWPDAYGEDMWPANIVRAETIDAFRDAFATLGYVVCGCVLRFSHVCCTSVHRSPPNPLFPRPKRPR